MITARQRVLRQIFLMASALAFFVFIFAPIYWMAATSFMTEKEMLAIPPHFFPSEPTLRNYQTVLGIGDPEFLAFARNRAPAVFDIFPALKNSLIVAIVVAIINLLVGIPAAYAFARLTYRRALPVLTIYLATRMLPPIMLVVPMFLIMRNLGLIDTPFALVMAYCVFTLPFTVWLLQAYFKTIPAELEDSAFIDGASRWQIVRHVLLPLAVPGCTCAAILAFMASWSEFLFAVVFSKTAASKTLPVVAASFVDTASIQFDYVMTAGVITALPPFLLALLFQRWIVNGLSAGALKG